LISLGRGDFVGAGLSAAAMIPFAGWGATVGKVGRKATKEAAEKVAKEAAEKRAKEVAERKAKSKSGVKVKLRELIEKLCGKKKKGNGKGKYRGGSHDKTLKPTGDGLDSHHMPAKDAYKGRDLHMDDGPTIQMDPTDHALTKSNGKVTGSQKYRAEIEDLLKKGDWEGAMQREIEDVKRVAKEIGDPHKYDEVIGEMQDYFNCLKLHALLP
jgi:hypothetical protein